MNTAIDDFVREFERQKRASIIRVDRRLKTTEWPSLKNFSGGSGQTYRLDFSFHQIGGQVDEDHSSVVVSLPESSSLGKEFMLYEKEKYVFEKVFPLMYQSWKDEKHAPNFYASTKSGTLIVENLNDGSLVVKKGLVNSVEECKMVFKALAQFHALSVAQLDEVVYSSLNDLTPVDPWIKNTMNGYHALEALTKYTKLACRSFPQNQQDEIRNMIQNLHFVIESALTTGRRADGFFVLLQGAVHRKNIFFELDKQTSRIIRCKFFNFQFSHLGSPVLDLMSYLLGNVEFQVFAENGDSLFEFYLEELHKNLAQFEHSREYNLSMLREDLRRHKEFFMYTLVNSVSLQWVPDDVSPTKPEEMIPGLIDVVTSEKYTLFARNWMNILSSW